MRRLRGADCRFRNKAGCKATIPHWARCPTSTFIRFLLLYQHLCGVRGIDDIRLGYTTGFAEPHHRQALVDNRDVFSINIVFSYWQHGLHMYLLRPAQ
jgi:hypothetical protein